VARHLGQRPPYEVGAGPHQINFALTFQVNHPVGRCQ